MLIRTMHMQPRGDRCQHSCACVLIAGMSAVLPHLVAKVDEEFRKGNLTEAHAAQDTLNKWYVTLNLLHCLRTSVVDAMHSLRVTALC
jgi:dihydrodipicolinate synthase/N-acetylneuraminate lyase